jgi:hypothetical protein
MSILTACGGLFGLFIGLSLGGTSFTWGGPEVISSLSAGGALLYLSIILLWKEAKATRRIFMHCRIRISKGIPLFAFLLLCRSIAGAGLHA